MHRVFVYGSLLAGEGNHRMMAGATLLGSAALPPRYTLLDLGPYPALIEGGETAVQGELYEVGDALLEALDRFERHPVLYERRPAWIGPGAGVFAYFWARQRPSHAVPIASGSWRQRRIEKAAGR